ncbi:MULTISPECIES: N-6 DNA methylase [Thiorhodovibrio]|uniref:N-6 DNA methylase n=1 Tax=Thiorhodovibrio TaxID=61593 RepID=UPI0019136541|nr:MULTISPECIES: N-6 DNA methylase [Thiorhodovibrio]MBK5970983.1 SAM-dependent methyltransferase [Thiorhodovibrio winogradskyi]WPL10652.1 Type I restriction-modification system methyltransferase subunit [Thiorhodovibrio litoralis]
MAKKPSDKWQFGDFQTPIELARTVVETLREVHHIAPDVVIEPTCGKGSFVRAAYEGFEHSRILGFEINPRHVDEANRLLNEASANDRALIKQADFFNTDWTETLSKLVGFVLVIGNPPWVTSSELGLLNSKNLPEKSNFQNRKGMEAITGSANFDISEWMLLQHIQWLSKREGAIAYLCKYSVARKVMRQVRQSVKHRFFGHVYPIDAKVFFGASVDACLFLLTTDAGDADFELYESLGASKPSRLIGERDGFMVNDLLNYEKWKHLNGQDPKYIWRSGIKHDCARVMEMEPLDGAYKNGLNEIVRCEDDYLYPLLKSSDIGNGRTQSYRKVVLVTQKRVGDDTSVIKNRAPKTWGYLVQHKSLLEGRRSSIYRNRPTFSVFGVGEYSFKDWKVAISGLYKKLRFNLVGPMDGKPVAFDDTVNFLAFDTEAEAAFVYRMVTSPPAMEFLESMVFWDEKRPITTQLLRRLSIKEVAREIGSLEEYLKWADSPRQTLGQLELGIAEKKNRYIEVAGS